MIRVEGDRGLQPRQRFVGAPGVNQELAFEGVESRVERFQFEGALRFPQGFLVPPLVREQVRVIDARVRVVRIELQRALEMSLGRGRVPVVPDGKNSELRVGRREAVVDLHRLFRRLFALGTTRTAGMSAADDVR